MHTLTLKEENIDAQGVYASEGYFDVFTYPLILGDASALQDPTGIFLSKSLASRIFGDYESAMGEALTWQHRQDFNVLGIFEDMPSNSSVQFDFVLPWSFFLTENEWITSWGNTAIQTYVLLNPEADFNVVNDKITHFVEEKTEGNITHRRQFLAKYTDLYLHGEYTEGILTGGRIEYVRLFSLIAAFILIIACINFMNLSTAKASGRFKEVAVKKTIGANRKALIFQYFTESFIIVAFAVLLSLVISYFLLPSFNQITGKSLTMAFSSELLIGLLVILLGVSLLAGSYPALFLSRFQPAAVLKGEVKRSGGAVLFRKALVVFQFGVSVFLIVGSLVVDSQLSFLRNKKLGLAKEQMVIIPIGDRETIGNLSAIKNELMRDAGVLGVTASSSIPGKVMGGYSVAAEGLPEGENPSTTGWIVDKDFPNVLDLDLIAGNTFQETFIPEKGYDYVINETLARRIGWQPEEAVGKWLNVLGNRMGRVIGVARDFHFRSLHNEIGPLALFISPRNFEYLMVKIAPDNIVATMGHVDRVWEKLVPYRPFEYTFLDQEYEGLYRAEVRSGQLLTIFTLLAIVIACLGLFGLAAFTAEQRTREIGIRKVLGASVTSIILMLSKDFGRLIVLAIVLASPLAYWIMNNWLQNFAYRIDVSWLTLIAAGIAALIIAIGTITYQAVKAALTNPIKALKYE